MDFTMVRQQLEGAAEVLLPYWRIQEDDQDQRTRFYRQYETFQELIHSDAYAGLSEADQNTALHRWYNAKTSETCERIFTEYGAVATNLRENYYNKIDIRIHNVAFDVKITNFPRSREVQEMRLDLRKRNDKDRLIRWLYLHQSEQQRHDMGNRLFLVCKGRNARESVRLKQSFDQIEVKIRTYMEYLRQIDYDFHEVTIPLEDGGETVVKSDVIVILPESEDLKQRLQNVCPTCRASYRMGVAKQSMYSGNMYLKCNCEGYKNV